MAKIEVIEDKENTKSLYFFISYSHAKVEKPDDFYFVVTEDKTHVPKCIHFEDLYDNKIYYYQTIFMVDKSAATKGKKPITIISNLSWMMTNILFHLI